MTDVGGRPHYFSSYRERALEDSVYQRSLSCDLDWPQYRAVSDKELNFPLAFVVTAYMDLRNLGEIPRTFVPF